MKWIAIKTKLPKLRGYYLVYTYLMGSRFMAIAHFDGKNFNGLSAQYEIISKATHWMPLPEPPGEEKK